MRWLWMVAAVMLAAPLMAQEEKKPETPNIGDLLIGGDPAVSKEGKLTLGPDRSGWGLDWKILSVGYDDNVLAVDRHKDSSGFIDSAAEARIGFDLGFVEIGVRGRIAGRYFFDADDNLLYDLRLGGFLRRQAKKGGDIGFGVSADMLYHNPTFYDLTGPVVRFEKTKRAAVVARAHFAYAMLDFMGLELGVFGSHSDFSEDNLTNSADNWDIGTDFSIWIRFWEFLELRPRFKFEYNWFRDVYDQFKDGSISGEDKLQLLKGTGSVDVKLRLVDLLSIVGTVYATRQDESAQGFHRYWMYGFTAAAELNIAIVRVNGGLTMWSREYDERFVTDSEGNKKTAFERMFSLFVEGRVNVWWAIYVGLRVDYDRRVSDFDNRGFANMQFAGFFGLAF